MNVLDILLQADVPQPQTKQFKQKRLSAACGHDILFTIRELGFSKVADIRKIHDDDGEMDLHIVLAGVVEPDLKNDDLKKKYSAPTPAELVKKLLLPGEIADLAREIEKLSGFRTATLEEIKKK